MGHGATQRDALDQGLFLIALDHSRQIGDALRARLTV
jgi:hypothetical protein